MYASKKSIFKINYTFSTGVDPNKCLNQIELPISLHSTLAKLYISYNLTYHGTGLNDFFFIHLESDLGV